MSARSGGGLAEWLREPKQQSQLWQARAISAEGGVRDLEQRLPQANNDRRSTEVECDALRRDKERLKAKLETMGREALRAKAPGGMAPRPTAEGEA